MAISKKEMNRLFSEVFDGSGQVVVLGEKEQFEFLDKFLPQLKNALGKNVKVEGVYKGSKRIANSRLDYRYIPIRSANQNFGYYSYDIGFEGNILTFGNYMIEKRDFKELSQIHLFFEKLDLLFAEEAKKAKKKEKIKNLKIGAIKAMVKEIADEDGFDYNFTEDSIKVTVWIRLSKSNALAVYIPYSKFQEAVQKIRPIVANIRAMQEEGVVFKIKSAVGMYWTESEKTDKTVF